MQRITFLEQVRVDAAYAYDLLPRGGQGVYQGEGLVKPLAHYDVDTPLIEGELPVVRMDIDGTITVPRV